MEPISPRLPGYAADVGDLSLAPAGHPSHLEQVGKQPQGQPLFSGVSLATDITVPEELFSTSL